MQSKPVYKVDSITDSESISIKVDRPAMVEDEFEDKEVVERRRKMEELYQIGKASRIGDKIGEKPPMMTVTNEYGEQHDVSVFQKDKQLRPDIHMRIISQHRQ